MMGVPPNTCTICYKIFSNERAPLILTTCGHTYCTECLTAILGNNEVICPECKQITSLMDNPITSLPKNRSLIDMIEYHEYISKYIEQPKVPESKKLLNILESSLIQFEDTYNKIMSEHSYLNEIKESFILRDIDELMDHIISIVNDYRSELHLKVKAEFEKVNLIKNFRNSIKNLKDKISKIKMRLQNEQAPVEKVVKTNLTKIENNHDEYEKLSIGKSSPKSMFLFESIDKDFLIENKTKKEKDIKENLTELDNKKFLLIGFNQNTNENDSEKYCKTISVAQSGLTEEEENDIKSDIEFTKLFNLTLKNYAKEIYNPCVYFYVNKFQIENLYDDIKKILPKICDFDEYVPKYKLNDINSNSQKKMIRAIQEASLESDYKRLKYIFVHYKINSNFIYSEILDHITYQTLTNINNNRSSSNDHIANNGVISVSSSVVNLAGSNQINNPEVNNNSQQVNSNRSSLFNPYNINNNYYLRNNSRLLALNSMNSGSNLNIKDKIFSMYTYLKNFKEKAELKEFTKFLIDEQNYLPFKVDVDNNLDIKFGRDFEWILNLSLF